jgi:hypothetical protein
MTREIEEIKTIVQENQKLFLSPLVGNFPKFAFGAIAINLCEIQQTFKRLWDLPEIGAAHDIAPNSQGPLNEYIRSARHAFAHPLTKNSDIEGTATVKWNFVFGKGTIFQINDRNFGCDYEDDVALIFGLRSLLYLRHLGLAHEYYCRALEAVCARHNVGYMADLRLHYPIVDQHEFWGTHHNKLALI